MAQTPGLKRILAALKPKFLNALTRIGLISDTHGFLDEQVFRHFEHCDEIWHAGDFGTLELAEKLKGFKPLTGVYGNIDGPDLQHMFARTKRWICEKTEVLMTHIGGYPGRYDPAVKKELTGKPPQLFICGHSHILKVIYDKALNCLHINPGAAGKQGWHKTRTLIRFEIDGANIQHCEIIELGSR